MISKKIQYNVIILLIDRRIKTIWESLHIFKKNYIYKYAKLYIFNAYTFLSKCNVLFSIKNYQTIYN